MQEQTFHYLRDSLERRLFEEGHVQLTAQGFYILFLGHRFNPTDHLRWNDAGRYIDRDPYVVEPYARNYGLNEPGPTPRSGGLSAANALKIKLLPDGSDWRKRSTTIVEKLLTLFGLREGQRQILEEAQLITPTYNPPAGGWTLKNHQRVAYFTVFDQVITTLTQRVNYLKEKGDIYEQLIVLLTQD